jgi:hypothetical protein
MKKLHSRQEFESWLCENGSLHDCRILRLDPPPGSDEVPPPARAIIVLAYQIEGNYRANSRSVSKVFRLVLDGPRQYSLPSGGLHRADHCSEGIEILGEGTGPIAFEIDVPALLTVVCPNVIIEQLPDLIETVKPWLSEREIFLTARTTPMPTPNRWVELFEKQGQQVAWHIYGEKPKERGNIPADYQGWFLQFPAVLDQQHQGISFIHCRPTDAGFSVHIENHGASPSLWLAAKRILGEFTDAEIHCGNCEFTAEEWRRALEKHEGAEPR